MTDFDLMVRFMLQALVVLGFCRLVGWIGKRFLGQTQVVMEMVAGVMLGPSLFGVLAPNVQASLFPRTIETLQNGVATSGKHPSMMILYVVAQLGLVLYMFLVGQEFDISHVRGKIGGAFGISIAGIAAPFALGAILAVTAMQGSGLFAPGIGNGARALYLGAAMSITAFPMLARILYERGLTGTRMGTLTLGAGAFDDAVAWALLAVVLAVTKGDPKVAIWAIGGGLTFAMVVLTVGKRLLTRLAEPIEREGSMSQNLFTGTILFIIAGAYFTDIIGLYAVFGAFIMGASMPKGAFAKAMRERLEPLTVGLLLPFFFVYSGLNTQLGLVDTPGLWLLAVLVFAAAVLGKGGACALAARATGEPWRESLMIGTLMNARGLMELIILNIGLQQKVITPTLFTIMVLMAIGTTLMASPIYVWLERRAFGKAPSGASVGAG